MRSVRIAEPAGVEATYLPRVGQGRPRHDGAARKRARKDVVPEGAVPEGTARKDVVAKDKEPSP